MQTSLSRAERIEAVEEASADGDRLVSVAVAHDASLGPTLERVEEAHAKAEYLDGRASGPLKRALERVVRELHRVEETPEDGLVVYAGVVGGSLETYVFTDPPGRVAEGVFEHGNAFVTAPLERGAASRRTVGLVVVERGGAAVGRLDGDGVETLETFESAVPGKTRAGGQSADRFRRRREERKREFFASVGEAAGREFDDPDALALGGTHVTVEAFRDGDYLPAELAARVAGTYAVEYAGERGLERLAAAANGDVGETHERAQRALSEFFSRLPDGDVTYGEERVGEALDYGAVDRLLVAADVDAATRELYAERADEEGGDVVVVPERVEGGARFARAFDGVGALLRFPVE
ncbi:single-stranded DNA-binding protein [Halarchaeum sp. CBA1220]|uniref:baeRF10 domain-containing protein n=1 Tax=Halarchaeum sp. CBA1220 TaxID=1853682 RepID=UPI000F3A8014|nr:Vms1/Ankzf1 family peptidyl-tRNA hydrolase [Halarchaeum sp. CBA1220]QLC33553.1 single-stranded DNA-binding protein [Halarchaeum sp. CBA1220]